MYIYIWEMCVVVRTNIFCVACVAWQTYGDLVVRPRRRRRRRLHTFLFRSITFERMHWFHSNFAELCITVKYRPSSMLVIFRQILTELRPFST